MTQSQDTRIETLRRQAATGDAQAVDALAAEMLRAGLVPDTLGLAVAMLVAQDVVRWGESQRDASRRGHAKRTMGLALNELANRAELADAPNKALRAAAKAALSRADHALLRQGG
jgi:hypothetical protein